MTINEIPYYMARALILTVIIEVLVSFIIGYRKKDLVNVMLVNIMTNPIVFIIPVYFNYKYGIISRNVVLLILEIMALIAEALVYKKHLINKKINPFVLSLILNLSSYLIGEIINYL